MKINGVILPVKERVNPSPPSKNFNTIPKNFNGFNQTTRNQSVLKSDAIITQISDFKDSNDQIIFSMSEEEKIQALNEIKGLFSASSIDYLTQKGLEDFDRKGEKRIDIAKSSGYIFMHIYLLYE